MNILIRTDCSPAIGMGHLMRCFALALVLKENGARVIFVMRDLNSQIMDNLNQANFEYYKIPLLAEDTLGTINIIKTLAIRLRWIIVDHYEVNSDWHKTMRPYTQKIMVIDDLADRAYDCDLLLNQNAAKTIHNHYRTLLPSHTQTLLGPSFALLRNEFSQFRTLVKKPNGVMRRILIFFGGGDYCQETIKALSACLKLNKKDMVIDVIVGAAYSSLDDIKCMCNDNANVRFFCQISNMAEIMSQADLAIGGGGITNWERCSLGLPAIVLSVAENQVTVARELESLGATKYLGKSTEVSEDEIMAALTDLNNDPQTLLNMSIKAASLVDGEGCKRVATELID